VVEGCVANGAGLQEWSEQHGAGTIATIALQRKGDAGGDRCGLRKRSEIWPWLFVAAELAGRANQDAAGVGIGTDGESAFLERDDDEALVLISLRGLD